MTAQSPRAVPIAVGTAGLDLVGDVEPALEEGWTARAAERCDHIRRSAHADRALAARSLAPAFVMDDAEERYARVPIGDGSWLVFEGGLYGVRS